MTTFVPLRRSLLRSALALGAVALAGCPASDDPMSDGDGSASDTESMTTDATATATGGEPVGWFQLGWGIDSFTPLQDGGDFEIVYGTQGAAMFPMPVRVGDMPLPDDPTDFSDPMAPVMDLELDIEGHNDGFGGHFKRIANYSMMFEPIGDGVYEFLYIAIILPDDKDPVDLEGLPAHLRVQITPFQSPPLVQELDLTVTLGPLPG